MSIELNIKELISISTDETFRTNLKKLVEKNIPIEERLTLYNNIANSVYSDGHRVYAIFSWELGLEYLDEKEIDNISKADLLRSYGLAWVELNLFDIALEYLNEAEEFLDDSDDSILIDIYFGLSITYKYLTNMPKAIEYSQKASKIAKKMNNHFEVSRA
jgi:tetratricopeptide (TPR) repeat protein